MFLIYRVYLGRENEKKILFHIYNIYVYNKYISYVLFQFVMMSSLTTLVMHMLNTSMPITPLE